MKGKGRKYIYLLSIVSIALVLSSCESSARYSDHFDFTGTVSEFSDEHTKGTHPSDVWFKITETNFWQIREMTSEGYTDTSSGITYTHFYLDSDITVSSNFWITGGNNVLCLNGYTITDTNHSDPLFWQDGGTFELCDCCMSDENNGGKITGVDDENNAGGVIHVNGGTFIMDGGIITENDSTVEAGAVYIYNGEFILNDGYITNNGTYSTDINGEVVMKNHGGAIAVGDKGVFTMNGGLISGNYAYDGGGVYVEAGGTANIYGGKITGNYATGDGAGIKGEYDDYNTATINMADTPYVKDNYLTDKRNTEYNVEINDRVRITLTGEIKSGASVGVTSTSGACQITSTESGTSYYESAYNYFHSDYIGYDIKLGTNCLTFDDDGEGTVVTDFTLNFMFYYEGKLQTLPVWGNTTSPTYWSTIYVEGSWDNWENGLQQLSANSPDNGVYSLTFASLALGVYYFQAVLEYNDSILQQQNFENKITGDIDLEFRIPSSAINDGSYTVTVDIDRPFSEILEDPRDIEYNVTLEVDFLYKGENYQIPSWTTVSLGCNEWTDLGYIAWYLPSNAVELAEKTDSEGNYYYAYTFSSLHVYTYETWGYAQYNGDHYWDTIREPLVDPNVIYFDVLKTDSGTGQVIHQTIDLGNEDDLSKLLPNLGGTGVDVLTDIALTVTILGDGLDVPSYGYLVLVGPFEVEGNSYGDNVEYPLTLVSDNNQTQVWKTEEIDSIGMDNYVADVEFRYYDDDYNSPGNMSVFNSSTHCYYYLWSTTANSATIYNYNYGSGPQASIDIETTYPGYKESSISFTQASYDVGVRGTVQTSVTIEPEGGEVTYESSDPSIATVDDKGVVTGVSLGEALITATVRAEGYFRSSATATINVTTVNSFTYHITIQNSSGADLGELPSDYHLLASGSFDGTWNEGGWWDWGSVYELTWNAELNTYDLVLDFIPEVSTHTGQAHYFNLYLSEYTYIEDYNNDVIGTYTITASPHVGDIGDVSEDITITSSYVNWDQAIATMFPDESGEYLTTTDFYLVVIDHDTNTSGFIKDVMTVQNDSYNDSTVFNGSTYCETAMGQTSAGNYYTYNAVAGTAEPGFVFYASIHDQTWNESGGWWDWSNNFYLNSGSTLVVPQVTAGHVAIYVCAGQSTHEDWGTWTSFDGGQTGGWITSYSSVEALMATYEWWL